MKKIFLISLLLLAKTGFAQSQGQIFHPYFGIKVTEYGFEKTLAWSGGVNNPQFAMADLNRDGKKDLVIFEHTTQQVKTFLSTGTAGNPQYRYDGKYEYYFPKVNDYLKLEDYNRDDIPDLIQRGSAGFDVYTGYYNEDNILSFQRYKPLYYYHPFSGSVNAYCEPSDIPGVADVDGDGDLDFLAYFIGGGFINYYRNCQVEDNLPPDSIRICLKDNCWGKVYQGFMRTQELASSCSDAGTSCKGCPEPEPKTTAHTGNTLLVFDVDGDGDMDYLNGGVTFDDIQLVKNGKANLSYGIDTMTSQDTIWQTGGRQLKMTLWPAAFNLDIDQDGRKDLLFSPHAPNTSENVKCITWYQNTGTAVSPTFSYRSDTFLVDKMIDAGTASYPVLYDYNKDGKLDLFIGSDGYFKNGSLRSRITYYENNSTPGAPSLDLKNNTFLGLDTLEGAALAMGDLDEDGKDDLVIGRSDGTLLFYSNHAASNTVQPVWQLSQFMMTGNANDTIDVGNYAAPVIYDIDKDGKNDLIIGCQVGYLYYYKNVNTTAGTVNLQKVTDKLGNVKANPKTQFAGFSTPYIGKMDNTGTDYLLLGSDIGELYRYDGFQNGNVTTAYTRIDTAYSRIVTGRRLAPTVGDIDGDGKYEMIIGNLLGGVSLYKQIFNVGMEEVANAAAKINLYPNPARDIVHMTWDEEFGNEELTIQIVNVAGSKMLQSTVNGGDKRADISITGLSSGMYYCILSSPDKKVVLKMSVIK